MSPDRADVGKEWKHGETEEKSADEDEDSLIKAVSEESLSLLKSLNYLIGAEYTKSTLNPVEYEFLTKSLGYTDDEVRKGAYRISTADRSHFNKWLCSRLTDSVSRLQK